MHTVYIKNVIQTDFIMSRCYDIQIRMNAKIRSSGLGPNNDGLYLAPMGELCALIVHLEKMSTIIRKLAVLL